MNRLLPILLLASVITLAQTTVSGRLPIVDGKSLYNSVEVSWPSFTSATGKSYAAGSTTVKVETDGTFSVALEPSQSSNPKFRYTVVYHSTSATPGFTGHWFIPQTSRVVNVREIETVEQAPGTAIDLNQIQCYGCNTGTVASFNGSRFQAANAFDQNGNLLPNIVVGAQSFESTRFADQYGNKASNGISFAISACGTTTPCQVVVPSSYPTTEQRPCDWLNFGMPKSGEGCSYTMAPTITVFDRRFGLYGTNADSTGNNSVGNYQAWLRYDSIFTAPVGLSTNQLWMNKVLQSSNILALNGGLNINQNGYSNKSYYLAHDLNIHGYTPGQKIGVKSFVNSRAVGDGLAFYGIVTCDGGFSAGSDEGCEGMDVQANQDTVEYTGTVSSSAGITVTINVSAGDGTQGAGRYLVDSSKALSAGNISNISNPVNSSTPLNVIGSGTSWPISTVNTSLSTAITAPGLLTVTVGTTSGMTTSTNVCIADSLSFEQVRPTTVSGTTFTATFRYPHTANAIVSAGGLCGYYVAFTADLATPAIYNAYSAYPLQNSLHYVLPVIRSTSGTSMDVWLQSPNSGYLAYRGQCCSTSTAYALYPGAEVTSVMQGQQLSSTLTLEVPVSFSNTDTVFLPHYHNLNAYAALHHVQRVFPQNHSANPGAWWLALDGLWTDSDVAMEVDNNTPPSIYSGGKSAPIMLQAGGSASQPWDYLLYTTKPPTGSFLMADSNSITTRIFTQPTVSNGLITIQSNPSQHRFEIANTALGTLTTLDAVTGAANFNGIVTTSALAGSGTASVAAGSAAGASPRISVAGTSISGTITLTTGTAPSSGTIATVNFPSTFNSAPNCVLGANGTQVPGLGWTPTTTSLNVTDTSPLTANATYKISYVCAQ